MFSYLLLKLVQTKQRTKPNMYIRLSNTYLKKINSYRKKNNKIQLKKIHTSYKFVSCPPRCPAQPPQTHPVGLSYRYIFFYDTSYCLHYQKKLFFLGHCRYWTCIVNTEAKGFVFWASSGCPLSSTDSFSFLLWLVCAVE